MKTVAPVILLCLLVADASPSAAAEDSAARTTIAAATLDAISNLREEIARTPLVRNLSVGDFLRQTESLDDLTRTLQRAEQIGGPRWIDDRTCQIQLQISGTRVAQALSRIAAADPRESPVSLGELTRALRDWNERSFSATGTAASRVPVATPRTTRVVQPDRDPWPGITKTAREQTLAAARLDAAQRALRSLTAVPLTPRTTVGDVLSVRQLGADMEQWFVSQPVASVEYQDNLQAQVVLDVPPARAFDEFRGMAAKQTDVVVPADDQAWTKVKTEFARRMAPPVGRAVAADDQQQGFGFERRPFGLKPQRNAPDWASRRLDAEGAGTRQAGQSRLQVARAAEADADARLRARLLDLPLSRDRTIGQAARDDKRVADAVTRALRYARIARTDYRDDGSARVELYLDLTHLWHEIRSID